MYERMYVCTYVSWMQTCDASDLGISYVTVESVYSPIHYYGLYTRTYSAHAHYPLTHMPICTPLAFCAYAMNTKKVGPSDHLYNAIICYSISSRTQTLPHCHADTAHKCFPQLSYTHTHLCNSKVCDLDGAVGGEQQVAWLYVFVHDAPAVEVLQTVH